MKFSKDYKVTHSIITDEEDLDFLMNYLGRNGAEITLFEAYLIDNTTYFLKDLNELKGYENRDGKKIVGLKIKGKSQGVDYDINIGESKFSFERNLIRYSSDDMNSYVNFENEVISRINEMKPMYSFVHRVNLTFVFPALLFLTSIVFTLFKLTHRLYVSEQTLDSSQQSKFSESEITVLTYLIYAIMFFTGYFLEKMKIKLFPDIFFLIGKQKKRYEGIKFWRNLILVTILIGIIINLLF